MSHLIHIEHIIHPPRLGDLPLGRFGFSNCFFGGSKMLDIALRTLLAFLDLNIYQLVIHWICRRVTHN